MSELPVKGDFRFYLMQGAACPHVLSQIAQSLGTKRKQAAQEVVAHRFPLADLLANSVFYPASGLDSDPTLYLGRHFFSFICSDYGIDTTSVIAAIEDRGWNAPWHRWEVLALREIADLDNLFNDWAINPSWRHEAGKSIQVSHTSAKPFAVWALMIEKNSGRVASLLFLGAESAATLELLYNRNDLTPAAIAIIQPSDAFGSNWTDFTRPGNTLQRLLSPSVVRHPKYLLYGGGGEAELYAEPCWSEYGRLISWPLKRNQRSGGGSLSLWERTE